MGLLSVFAVGVVVYAITGMLIMAAIPMVAAINAFIERLPGLLASQVGDGPSGQTCCGRDGRREAGGELRMEPRSSAPDTAAGRERVSVTVGFP